MLNGILLNATVKCNRWIAVDHADQTDRYNDR